MSDPRFRVLDALGTELDGAIAREQRRRVPRARAFVLTLLATLLLAGATATASYLLTGSPIPGRMRATCRTSPRRCARPRG